MTESPLSLEDIEKIDTTLLPALARHHLRVLAHCLAAFKTISGGKASGPFPSEPEKLKWLNKQESIKNDQKFISLLLNQFSSAELQLKKLAQANGLSPLELTLEDLIASSIEQQNASSFSKEKKSLESVDPDHLSRE